MRDIESEVIEWLEWHIGAQSGRMGLPSSYDVGVPRGSTIKSAPTPPDFPRRLRVCDMAVRTLPDKLISALMAKYLLLDTTDDCRAAYLEISRSQFYRRIDKARCWLKQAYDIASQIEKRINREMA